MGKRAPVLLSALFIGVTVTRVSRFAGGGLLGWLFALGLAGGVFVAAYFVDYGQTGAKKRPTARPALAALVFFVFVDGLFNLADVINHSLESGRWMTQVVLLDGIYWYPYRLADILYGAFPTIAVALLGWLARGADKIGGRPKGWRKALEGFVTGWLLGHTEGIPAEVEIVEPVPPRELPKPRPPAKRKLPPQEAIYRMLDRVPEGEELPSVRTIAAEVGCSTSTASINRRKWEAARG